MIELLHLTLRLGLGCTWIAAGTAKLLRPPPDDALGLVPPVLRAAEVKLLPWLELPLGVCLAAGYREQAAAAASGLLLLIFSVAVGAHLARGGAAPCNCFGYAGGAPVSRKTLLRNLLLLGGTALLLALPTGFLSVDGLARGEALGPHPPSAPAAALWFLVLGVAAAMAMLLGAAWAVVRAVAHSEGGPASGLPEHRLLRRWLRVGPELPGVPGERSTGG